MVLKSLGKKLKSIGGKGKKSKQDETPSPPGVGTPEGGIGGNALPLHNWKGGKPGTKGDTGPKIGGSRKDHKPGKHGPTRVKGGKAAEEGSPMPWLRDGCVEAFLHRQYIVERNGSIDGGAWAVRSERPRDVRHPGAALRGGPDTGPAEPSARLAPMLPTERER